MILFLVWFLGFAISFVLTLGLLFKHPELPLGSYLLKVIGLFAPYLTPIVTFWFARGSEQVRPAANAPYMVAVICSLFYNIVLVGIIGSLHLVENYFESRLDLANDVAAGLAFLVGPAIGYYFGKTDGDGGREPPSSSAG